MIASRISYLIFIWFLAVQSIFSIMKNFCIEKRELILSIFLTHESCDMINKTTYSKFSKNTLLPFFSESKWRKLLFLNSLNFNDWRLKIIYFSMSRAEKNYILYWHIKNSYFLLFIRFNIDHFLFCKLSLNIKTMLIKYTMYITKCIK